MKTPIYVDSCAWNYLFDAEVAMGNIFPSQEFTLLITREVEIELLEIPDIGKDGTDKRPLKRFIQQSISNLPVRTTSFFGFATFEKDGTRSKHQVNSGFGQGGFRPAADRDWYAQEDVRKHLDGKPLRGSTLSRNQADASLGVRSFGAILLTNEKKTNSGPIRVAADQSGHVLYLRDLEASSLTLKDFVLAARRRWIENGSRQTGS